MAGGHAWQESVCSRGASVAGMCMAGGMCGGGGGHLWQGVWVAEDVRAAEQND